MQKNIYKKTCATCGAGFNGGPSAKYCPTCRAERTRKRDKERHIRGPVRPLGSIDLCKNCGDKYEVVAGCQKYCKKCSKMMQKKNKNEATRLKYRTNAEYREKILAVSKSWKEEHPERVKESSRRSYIKLKTIIINRRRLRFGYKLIPLGSTVKCKKCGGDFILQEHHQLYCKKCKPRR